MMDKQALKDTIQDNARIQAKFRSYADGTFNSLVDDARRQFILELIYNAISVFNQEL